MNFERAYGVMAVIALICVMGLFLRRRQRRDEPLPVSYDQIIASVHDAVLVLNTEGYIIGVNLAAQRLLRVPREVLNNRRLSSVLPLPPHIVLKGQEKAEFEHEIAGKLCEIDSLPLLNKNTVLGRILVLRDITARKQAEREAQELAFEREKALILSRFIRDASHEFRTPVTVIKTSLYLIARQTDAEKRAKQIVTVGEQIGRLSRLIGDLQKMSLLDGFPALNYVDSDLIPVIDTAVNQAKRQHDGRQVHVNIEKQPITFAFDSIELEQALFRLLDNALRYSSAETTVTVRVHQQEADVHIDIQDIGIGMDADTMRQAPQRFYRNDNAHTTAGFGLGLPIAKAIIELHDGSLALDSQVGKGTLVNIRLPLADKRQNASNTIQSAMN